jgi:hypothetical protein
MMIKRIAAVALTSAAAVAMMTGPAMGAVSYTDGLPTFVGKGDVQTAFSLNNAKLQDAARNGLVAFSYAVSEDYTAVCEFVTGEGTKGEQTHAVPRTKTADVTATVAGDPRKTSGQNQFTGYNLTTSNVVPSAPPGCR